MMRSVRAAQLLDRGFANNTLSWLKPSLGTVDNLVPIDASPPNLRDEMCGGKRKHPSSDEDEEMVAGADTGNGSSGMSFYAAGLQPPTTKPAELLAGPAAPSEPIPVYTGPTRTGAALIAAIAADSEKQAARHRGRKKAQLAAKKPDKETAEGAAADGGKAAAKEAKPEAKPAAARHANVKPDATPKTAEKAAATARPAKPKAAVKRSSRPAAKSTSEAVPATPRT
jgi:D-alanyl-D-alanine carboxypeptidase